ncbi:MAG: efflux RND transporter periplasmic adaptor subunit [Deltaproteobacteria bacterium]|nr:efflux RND transporter periplasmic adaptor subunit [Deltaproteobacteria bacterium]
MEKTELSQLSIDRNSTIGGSPRSPRRSRRRFLWLLLLLMLVMAGGAAWRQGWLIPVPEVQVAIVSRQSPAHSLAVLNATGYVVAQRKVAVASKGTGRLAYLGVEEGRVVTMGEIIARLENEDLTAARDEAAARVQANLAAVEQARAEVYDAEIQFRRSRELLGKQSISRSEFDAADVRRLKSKAAELFAVRNVEVSKAVLRQAQATLDYTFIRAPFNAVVLTKDADVGEVVAPFGSAASAKAAVATMADMDSLMVEADVSESNISKVQTNQPCLITLDALPDTYQEGQVHVIMPTADRSKGTITAKVSFNKRDERVRPEMSAKVAFLKRPLADDERQPRLSIRASSLATGFDQPKVWRLDEDRVTLVTLKIGARLGDTLEVLGGLKDGDRIVAAPQPGLVNGGRVKIQKQ